MKNNNEQFLNNEIDYKEYSSVRDSYRGHLKYGNCKHLYDKYVIEYIEAK